VASSLGGRVTGLCAAL